MFAFIVTNIKALWLLKYTSSVFISSTEFNIIVNAILLPTRIEFSGTDIG